MKVKLFGVGTEEGILSKFGLGPQKSGLPEMEREINSFISDKKLVEIKMATAQTSYQNAMHAIMFAMVVYDEPAQGQQPSQAIQP